MTLAYRPNCYQFLRAAATLGSEYILYIINNLCTSKSIVLLVVITGAWLDWTLVSVDQVTPAYDNEYNARKPTIAIILITAQRLLWRTDLKLGSIFG